MRDIEIGGGDKAPWFLWAIGGVAVAWNGLGTFLWSSSTFMPEVALTNLPAAHLEYFNSLPSWVTYTWGLGVLAGVVGTLLLLLRNGLAVPVLALSLAGAIANQGAYITNPPPEGFFNLPLTVFIIGFAMFLLWFANHMKQNGVLR